MSDPYRDEGLKMGLIVPTFTEFYEARHGKWPVKGQVFPDQSVEGGFNLWEAQIMETIRDYLDLYGPGARK